MRRILLNPGRFLVAMLILILVAPNGWSASGASRKADDADDEGVILQIHGNEFKFVPNILKVVKGQKVTIIFTNDGVLAHNFAIESPLGLKTKTIQSHETAKLTFTPQKTGSFKFRCLVPGHMQAGMQGKLIVTDSR